MIEFAGAVTAAPRGDARDIERELAMSLSKSNAGRAAHRLPDPAIQSDKSFAAGRSQARTAARVGASAPASA